MANESKSIFEENRCRKSSFLKDYVQEVRLEFRLARHSFRFVAGMAGKGGDVSVSLGGGVVRLREASIDKEEEKKM